MTWRPGDEAWLLPIKADGGLSAAIIYVERLWPRLVKQSLELHQQILFTEVDDVMVVSLICSPRSARREEGYSFWQTDGSRVFTRMKVNIKRNPVVSLKYFSLWYSRASVCLSSCFGRRCNRLSMSRKTFFRVCNSLHFSVEKDRNLSDRRIYS